MAGMIIKLNHLHRETNSSFQPLSLVFTRLVLLALLCLAPLSLSCKGGRAALGSAGHVEAKRTSGAEPDRRADIRHMRGLDEEVEAAGDEIPAPVCVDHHDVDVADFMGGGDHLKGRLVDEGGW